MNCPVCQQQLVPNVNKLINQNNDFFVCNQLDDHTVKWYRNNDWHIMIDYKDSIAQIGAVTTQYGESTFYIIVDTHINYIAAVCFQDAANLIQRYLKLNCFI